MQNGSVALFIHSLPPTNSVNLDRTRRHSTSTRCTTTYSTLVFPPKCYGVSVLDGSTPRSCPFYCPSNLSKIRGKSHSWQSVESEVLAVWRKIIIEFQNRFFPGKRYISFTNLIKLLTKGQSYLSIFILNLWQNSALCKRTHFVRRIHGDWGPRCFK